MRIREQNLEYQSGELKNRDETNNHYYTKKIQGLKRGIQK